MGCEFFCLGLKVWVCRLWADFFKVKGFVRLEHQSLITFSKEGLRWVTWIQVNAEIMLRIFHLGFKAFRPSFKVFFGVRIYN